MRSGVETAETNKVQEAQLADCAQSTTSITSGGLTHTVQSASRDEEEASSGLHPYMVKVAIVHVFGIHSQCSRLNGEQLTGSSLAPFSLVQSYSSRS